MKHVFMRFNILLLTVICLHSTALADRGVFDIDRWDNVILNIKTDAQKHNINSDIINEVCKNSAFIPNIVKTDQRQSEFTLTLEQYLNRVIDDNRIANGKKMKSVYPTLLSKVEKKYHIQPNVILAFWGMESNYGKIKSSHQLTNAFITLIYEGRREEFFTKQLLALMQIANKNKLTIQNIRGSWAGAMGHFQFIPTTLLQYGVDGNNDGKIDIINSISDAMYSAANYLNKLGWNDKEPITKKVIIPYEFSRNLLNGDIKKTISEWSDMGIRNIDGTILTKSDKFVGVIVDTKSLAQKDLEMLSNQEILASDIPVFIEGYLTYPNFYRIKKWNNSNWYAIAISELANKLK